MSKNNRNKKLQTMKHVAVTLTPENTREAFRGATIFYAMSYGEEKDRHQLLTILQSTDNDVRDVLADCVNEFHATEAFDCASFNKDTEILQAFYEIGMDVNAKTERGSNALSGSGGQGHVESVYWLLDHGADVNIQDKNGSTPLMSASWNGKQEIVEILLQKYANADVQNNAGKTALMIASEYHNKEVVQVLLNHNADLHLRNKEGQTALDLAKNNQEIMELLQNHVTTSYVLK